MNKKIVKNRRYPASEAGAGGGGASGSKNGGHSASDEKALRERVALIAWYRAKERGFAPGHELEDWLRAEHEVYGSPSDQA